MFSFLVVTAFLACKVFFYYQSFNRHDKKTHTTLLYIHINFFFKVSRFQITLLTT